MHPSLYFRRTPRGKGVSRAEQTIQMTTNKKHFEVKKVRAELHAGNYSIRDFALPGTVECSCRVVLVNMHRYLRHLP
jgi:hypothetical protein